MESIPPESAAHSAALGAPPPGCGDSDPWQQVFEALRYLRDNAGRKRYGEYRRLGLPILTSAEESTIKPINRRVKGGEKSWSGPGAKANLRLRADCLSETEPLTPLREQRERAATGRRPYRRAG